MKLLLYCTKAKPYLIGRKYAPYEYYLDRGGKHSVMDSRDFIHNGKIVAECDFRVEEIVCDLRNTKEKGFFEEYTTKSLSEKELLYASQIDEISFINYLDSKNGYAIHIKNLNIFDKPKELNDYITKQCQYDRCSTCEYGKKEIHCSTIDTPITKAPQNMMYCYDEKDEKYVLISIRPEWLCKILNGEKTIEIRKKVLKEMLNDK